MSAGHGSSFAAAALALVVPAAAAAGPVLGFVETWPGTSLASWTAISNDSRYAPATLYNPSRFGTGGIDDGYLGVRAGDPVFLDMIEVASSSAAYTGDWRAAGVGGVTVYLNDISGVDDLEIHLWIEGPSAVWQFDAGFRPEPGRWSLFGANLGSEEGWTRLTGTDTFEATIRQVIRIGLRHDRPPFTRAADPVRGSLGIDELRLVDRSTPAAASTWGSLKSRFRGAGVPPPRVRR